MTQEAKVIVGIGIATLLIFIGGVFFLSGSVDEKALLRNAEHSQGTVNTKVRLVEFADFQCPACAAFHPVVEQVVETHEGKMSFVYRHFPLSQHKNAWLAAKVSEAASQQGKFWEMHKVLYERQNEWSESDDVVEQFRTYAETINLDMEQFAKAVNSSNIDGGIEQDVADGKSLGVTATPTFFLNGKKLVMNSFADLPRTIAEEIKK